MQTERLSAAPISSTRSVAEKVAETAVEASDLDLGRGLIGLARRLRLECQGQHPDVPNLRSPNATYESLVAWEVLPEMSDRLMRRAGVQMARTREELSVPSMEIFSDADLRKSLADGMKFSRFAGIAEKLRSLEDPADIQPGRLLACELISQPIPAGNVLAISCARLSPDPEPWSAEAQDDWFLREQRRAAMPEDDLPEAMV